MKKLTFFTLRDFSKHGGGSLRIKGILNALSKRGVSVTLISSTNDVSAFDVNIRHIPLKIYLTKKEKNLFRLLLALFPLIVVNFFFRKQLSMFRTLSEQNHLEKEEIIFFENFDNALGYFCKRNNIISRYVNDIHGIAPMEFKEKTATNFIQMIFLHIKYLVAKRLDKKVFTFADGLIFVSEEMKKYFEDIYPEISNIDRYIIRDGVSKRFCEQKVDLKLLEELKLQYGIEDQDKIVFFAGEFKDLGGVLDLIEAFAMTLKKFQGIKLFLIGKGELMPSAMRKVKKFGMEDSVIFAGTVPYGKLKTYQQLSDVVVCPDIKHRYSEIVPHIKYFDSLASGKIVINGSFASIRAINPNQKLSVDFEPSNINDLSDKMVYVLNNLDTLTLKYKDVQAYVCSEYLYDSNVEKFYKQRFEK